MAVVVKPLHTVWVIGIGISTFGVGFTVTVKVNTVGLVHPLAVRVKKNCVATGTLDVLFNTRLMADVFPLEAAPALISGTDVWDQA